MDAFLHITLLNECYSKNIQPLTEKHLKQIEIDDEQLKTLKLELEQKYDLIEEKIRQKVNGNTVLDIVDEQIEQLEKLQERYDQLVEKRQKIATKNHQQLEKFISTYELALTALKMDISDRSVLANSINNGEDQQLNIEPLNNSNLFQNSQFNTQQMDTLFKRRLDNYWKDGSSIHYR
ncbi:unnamed protein product [Didymodactylos carnosus]|uniref:Uncharacterized protein n=1 Tax=Didymodactylos carnosus TaxID=1234261 RepID=A0A815BTX0_9BILA|nr:unnamed protein product [Didymodactylos carnosus]CAF1274150.1 unnamed protein product [Didymodactylos carnosus]CAF4020052.1 unnamed protein product [Didymodactylos carnosus]CAF4064372.1 unnamed protein product [Didymodactylos carnosus]